MRQFMLTIANFIFEFVNTVFNGIVFEFNGLYVSIWQCFIAFLIIVSFIAVFWRGTKF